nr:hypothetical protein [uncultured Campylobacter sp.]
MTKNDIKDALQNKLGTEIASGFRVLKERELARFNDEARFDFEGESEILREFYIFADTVAGDLWLTSLKDGKVALYDHDDGDLCSANLIKFDLDIPGWLEIAQTFKKFETIDKPNAEQTAKFKQAVSAVCPQILEIWDI